MPPQLPISNSYALLMMILAPNKSEAFLKAFHQAAKAQKIHWEQLLYQANQQLCTPLWYARLKKDDLLNYLPSELEDYLFQIYQSNKQRNQQLKAALIDLLREFNSADIDTLLIKGAATFCDQLFAEPGSRFMGDLDILVPNDKVEQCRDIIIRLGYEEIPDEGMEPDGLPTDERHHQLPRYFIPETPVVVEIHFKISYAQVGRMISPEAAWQSRCKTELMGCKTSVLSPDHKLLLNAAHALVPHREYLRGQITPLQLSEFVLLAQRYAEQIHWQTWLETAHQFSLSNEFQSYLQLAVKYMNLSPPKKILLQNHSKFNEKRIVFIGNYDAIIDRKTDTIKQKIIRQYYHLYYYIKLPRWLWQNICYAPGWKNIPVRLLFCLKKTLSPKSWQKL